MTGEPSVARSEAMVRAIVRRAVLELLRREVVRGGAPGTIIAEWKIGRAHV